VNDAWRHANTEITNQLIAGRLEGLQHEVVIGQGDVWEELQRMLDRFQIDLIVTGTRGRSGVWKLLMGSTAERIFRNSPVPVLTVGPNAPADAPEAGPKRVLYTTGFAAQSIYAGTFALSLADQQQARLAMLHVIKETHGQPQTALREEAEHRLRELVPSGMQLPAPPEMFVEFGNISECILSVAEHWRPELIVLGVRQHPKEAGRAAWATAYSIVSNAPCPVLTVKAMEEL
jgi:nucleotide-binding universal stress UspA family protein